MVGYATVYTMFPVFSLVLDVDVSDEIAMMYPELYNDLTKVIPRPCVAVVFSFYYRVGDVNVAHLFSLDV